MKITFLGTAASEAYPGAVLRLYELHPELSRLTRARGYEAAYDGLAVEL